MLSIPHLNQTLYENSIEKYQVSIALSVEWALAAIAPSDFKA